MKKIVKFIKVGVRNGTRKSVESVETLPSIDDVRVSHVDDFGRVVDGPGISKTHYVRTRSERNDAQKSLSEYEPTGGIHTMDPADIIELMF